jgi:anti-anti-sigma factor
MDDSSSSTSENSAPLSFQKTSDDTALFTVRGEIDGDEMVAALSTVAGRAFEDKSIKNLLLDFSGLDYIFSLGLGEMISWYRQAVERGGRVFFFGESPRVAELLEVVGFKTLAEPAISREEAEKILRGE